MIEVVGPGQALVHRRVLAGQPDELAHLVRVAHDVVAADASPDPPSGRSSVARMRTAVVLPAPFGPSSPSTLPVRAVRSTPASAVVLPNRLTSPCVSMA